jgi:diacylglycerol kinase
MLFSPFGTLAIEMLLLTFGVMMPMIVEMLQSSIETLKGVVAEMSRLLVGTLNPKLL